MKILLVCQYFFPEQFRVNDICFELVKEGHEVTVLTGLPNYPSGVVQEKYKFFKNRKEEINGVTIIRSWLLGRGKGTKRLALNYISFAISSTLKALFIKKDFDLILVYQLSPVTMALPAITLKKITKKPLVLYCHDLWPESIASAGISSDSRIYNVLLKFSKWIYGNADEIFTSSKLFEEYFKDTLGINDGITHLPVYAEALFEKISSKNKNSDVFDLVFAGNIGEMQSVETIIYAANELKKYENVKFHIVGDGSSREKCETLAQRLELNNVIFYGQHPITEMPKFYEMADAFLVTLKENKAISYTLPNKVQSYMAAGKPIIGAIDGETQVVIKEAKCGLCSSAEDYEELADNIRLFVKEKEKHYLYSQNARNYYECNFSKKIYMEKLNYLLERIK
ncbi:glycosyltransferase family 4 protein [Bacillus sp. B3-WWTP-C-10-D-3]|uniref:glycosyltransferase family 4 protein n=1 Tax=Bacillus sp. B3-WWTP-C-10-D-3 TaxID=2653217 RepID=UPI000BEB2BF1|nr:glycosyltransferase family 4 protein [Bacillus sp. B3-WWTP-C-10-D-3]KAB7639887.1 glycosyltransferase family 4 protein [Bacillus sp. B3-WWTP-C-10-D-3]PDY95845.1 glycosyltransferase WbuB [Bacillus anthracis]